MPKNTPRSVDEYLDMLPDSARATLESVRNAIGAAVPGAQEAISYNLPTFLLDGKPLLYVAAWKRHYSLYPANERVIAVFASDLAPYEIRNGTIRFRYTTPAPIALIGRIAAFRADELGCGRP